MAKDDEKPSALSVFLSRNSVGEANPLPLIHTTRSYNIASIKDADEISPTRCPVFDERLIYLFMGRPAYKRVDSGSQADYWELPCCFIFDHLESVKFKRVYPFDSGAFSAGRYPDYVKFMPLSAFEAEANSAPGKIISAFFGSASKYFFGEAKDKDSFENEFNLGVLETEVRALRRLAQDGTPANFDDRRFTVEIQMSDKLEFDKTPPSAVVLPSIYLRDEDIRRKIIDEWKAEPITYEVYSLSLSAYDGIIYGKVQEYLQKKGLL